MILEETLVGINLSPMQFLLAFCYIQNLELKHSSYLARKPKISFLKLLPNNSLVFRFLENFKLI